MKADTKLCKALAEEIGWQWIVDAQDDVCLRRRIYGEGQIETIQPRPDPGEYVPAERAWYRLQALRAIRDLKDSRGL